MQNYDEWLAKLHEQSPNEARTVERNLRELEDAGEVKIVKGFKDAVNKLLKSPPQPYCIAYDVLRDAQRIMSCKGTKISTSAIPKKEYLTHAGIIGREDIKDFVINLHNAEHYSIIEPDLRENERDDWTNTLAEMRNPSSTSVESEKLERRLGSLLRRIMRASAYAREYIRDRMIENISISYKTRVFVTIEPTIRDKYGPQVASKLNRLLALGLPECETLVVLNYRLKSNA